MHAKKTVFKFLLSVLVSLTMIFPSLFADSLSIASIGNDSNTSTEDEAYFTWDNATVYFTITDRFYNGNTANDTSYGRVKVDATGKNIGTFHGGDVAGLTQKLKEGYFKKLGVNAIWMTAPYEQMHGFVGGGSSGDFAHYAYHGYYALDYTMMDKNMGTIAEMRAFVDEAHSQGIRVILDIVMNHPGYLSMKDMTEYDIMPTSHSKSELLNWSPINGQNWHSYHDLFIDYIGHNSDWAKWWGPGWIRAGVAGYTAGDNSELRMNLSGLPDFKTEITSNQGLAPILKTKWSKETSGYDHWIVPAAKSLRTDLGIAPTDYNIKWLAAWVREFGIDGFRVDTAKHVEPFRWAQLKNACDSALKAWRATNPAKAGANWDDDFWMTGEVYNTGVEYKPEYFETGKFDSLINFFFPKDGNLNTINNTYQDIANKVNTKNNWNVLSYISSHDEGLTRANMTNLGTALLLSPGGIQIFYGDETNRPGGQTCSDKDQPSRSDMNWSSINESTLNHWQILGTFRKNHPSIGAGTHTVISSSPYVFSRTYNKENVSDKVIVALNVSGRTTINVSSIFKDGTQVRDAYTGTTATVTNGSITLTAGSAGVILIEQNGQEPVTPPLTPIVTLTPGSSTATTTYTSDTLSIQATLKNVTNATYQIDNGEVFSITSGQSIEIGRNVATGTTTSINVKAQNESGLFDKTFLYQKQAVPPTKDITVHFYKPSSWGIPNLYYYQSESITGPKWPGEAMSSEGDGWYSYTIKNQSAAYVLFNSNGQQIPGANEPGLNVSNEVWYKDGTLYTTKPKEQVITVHFYNPSGWGIPNLYYYETESKTGPAWPGQAMTSEGNNWYTYTIPSKVPVKVLFNSNNEQIPGSNESGFEVNGEMWYKNGIWTSSIPN